MTTYCADKKTTRHHRPQLLVTALAAAIWVMGCSPDRSEPSAASEPPKEAVPASQAADDATTGVTGTLALSPQNTTIAFLGEKLVGNHHGEFKAFSGTVSFKNGDPVTAKVKVKIDMSSVKTDEEKLDGHLKSPDFFDVAKFPDGTFVSTGITKGGADNATHTINGNLTLRGVTKAIAIPAKIEVSEKKVAVTGDVVINRQDFGISFPGMPDNLIKDNVSISLKINGNL